MSIDLAIPQSLLILEVNGYKTSEVYVGSSMTLYKSFILDSINSYTVHELPNWNIFIG